AWADVTTSVDPVAQLVCGVVSSLSPFALGTVISPTFLAQAYLKSLVQAPGRRFTLLLDLLFLERPVEDVVVSVVPAGREYHHPPRPRTRDTASAGSQYKGAQACPAR
ncbi:hypothetical protein NGA_0713100, partial [Nannochloropsis gaditana CCMP526]|uniref:uncharacterized protein n=1 Tax=Nannochloropsis gaditana (strain CCMP526) TaxID=1093141 RepID=UPI00029F7743